MTNPTRRTVLIGLGAGAIAAACSSTTSDPVADTATTTPTTTTTPPGSSLTNSPVGTCVILPESTAGPFGLTQQFERRDITEGYPGHSLEVTLQVVDANCAGVPGAEVEIWHADATGDYSAFVDNGTGKDEAEGTTFLRGTQTTDTDGKATFDTIVPGWYPGRAVHIHITVRLAGGRSHTGQLFFDSAFLDEVYTADPYLSEGPIDTPNASDSIARNLVTEMLLRPVAAGSGSRAELSLVV